MRKSLLFLATIFGVAATYGQAYVSIGGGYGFPMHQKVLGSEITTAGTTELKGSYGAGFQTQLRGGYFFNKTIGLEASVGYLHGDDVDVNKNPFLTMKARGRVFGASLSAVANITKSLYVRAGGVTKIGGRTEVITNLDLSRMFPATADFQTNLKAEMPYGFIGGIGYRFFLTPKIAFFVEGEYLYMNVYRKTSKLDSFSGSYRGNNIGMEQKDNFVKGLQMLQTMLPDTNPAKAQLTQLNGRILPLLEDEHDWTDLEKDKREAPYSSLGANFGFTFYF